MSRSTQIAHMNVARLRHDPGDPRVAPFIDNVTRVNGIAERSPGFVWRMSNEAAAVADGIEYQALDGDPRLAISLSVWRSAEHLQHFVYKTVHGGFFRRRAEWFEPYGGPNYVLWDHAGVMPPTLDEGWRRLRHLTDHGPSPQAYDFAYLGHAGKH